MYYSPFHNLQAENFLICPALSSSIFGVLKPLSPPILIQFRLPNGQKNRLGIVLLSCYGYSIDPQTSNSFLFNIVISLFPM